MKIVKVVLKTVLFVTKTECKNHPFVHVTQEIMKTVDIVTLVLINVNSVLTKLKIVTLVPMTV